MPLVPLPGNGLGSNSNNFNNNNNNNNNNKVMTTSTNRRSLHTEMLEHLLLAPVHEKEMEMDNRLTLTNSSPSAHHQRTPTSPLPHQRGSTSPLPHHQRAPTSPLSVAASSGHFSATPSPGSELLARLRSETVCITNCSLLLLMSETDVCITNSHPCSCQRVMCVIQIVHSCYLDRRVTCVIQIVHSCCSGLRWTC